MKSKSKVLMFIDWYLPGFRAGGPIRSCANLVAHLADEFEFYIVASDTDYQSTEPYRGIAYSAWNTLSHGEHVRYLPGGALDHDFLQQVTEELDPDCIYIHGVFSPTFSVKTHRFYRSKEIPVVIAPRGMLKHSALALKRFKKLTYLRFARLFAWYSDTVFHATDQQEVQDIRQHFGEGVEIRLAPNLPLMAEAHSDIPAKSSGELQLLFAGRIAPEKNLAFGLELLSKSGLSGITLDVYGAVYDEAYAKHCRAIAHGMKDRVLVRFHAPVEPREVIEKIRAHHALFLPTRGENFGHVILESFMCSRPVVISDQTPWRGLASRGAGFDLPLADEAAWLESLTALLSMKEDAYQAMCLAAREEYEVFSTDENLLRASKDLFLPGE